MDFLKEPNLSPSDFVLDPEKAPVVLDALQQLMITPGWRIYAAMLEGTRRALQAQVTKLDEPYKLLRTSGALGQVELLATWPEKQIKAIQMQQARKEK